MTQGQHTYLISGGRPGKARMGVIARVMAPSTEALLDRLPSLGGATVVDAGCGGGEVSFVLAERVGATGRVIGLDLDTEKLALARSEATDRGLRNIEFCKADVLESWPVEGASLILARFILTHLPRPERMLAHAHAALAPGGIIAAQDIDYRGRFCDPPSQAFDRYVGLYVATARHRGGDRTSARVCRGCSKNAASSTSTRCLFSRSATLRT